MTDPHDLGSNPGCVTRCPGLRGLSGHELTRHTSSRGHCGASRCVSYRRQCCATKPGDPVRGKHRVGPNGCVLGAVYTPMGKRTGLPAGTVEGAGAARRRLGHSPGNNTDCGDLQGPQEKFKCVLCRRAWIYPLHDGEIMHRTQPANISVYSQRLLKLIYFQHLYKNYWGENNPVPEYFQS